MNPCYPFLSTPRLALNSNVIAETPTWTIKWKFNFKKASPQNTHKQYGNKLIHAPLILFIQTIEIDYLPRCNVESIDSKDLMQALIQGDTTQIARGM